MRLKRPAYLLLAILAAAISLVLFLLTIEHGVALYNHWDTTWIFDLDPSLPWLVFDYVVASIMFIVSLLFSQRYFDHHEKYDY